MCADVGYDVKHIPTGAPVNPTGVHRRANGKSVPFSCSPWGTKWSASSFRHKAPQRLLYVRGFPLLSYFFCFVSFGEAWGVTVGKRFPERKRPVLASLRGRAWLLARQVVVSLLAGRRRK